MTKKAVYNIQSTVESSGIFDPSRFGDPLALEVFWAPAKKQQTHFCLYRFKMVQPNLAAMRCSPFDRLLPSLTMLVGLGILAKGIIVSTTSNHFQSESAELLILFLIGALFVFLGIQLLRSTLSPIHFDLDRGVFWRGPKPPAISSGGTQNLAYSNIDQIYAIQVLPKAGFVNDQTTKYSQIYETNLIMPDGSRSNVVDCGSYKALTDDARKLGEFLNKPVWIGEV